MKQKLIDYAEVNSKPFLDTAMAELAHDVAIPVPVFRQLYWNHRGTYDLGQISRNSWETPLGPDQELHDGKFDAFVRIDLSRTESQATQEKTNRAVGRIKTGIEVRRNSDRRNVLGRFH